MNVLIGYPGTGIFAQSIARALWEHEALQCYSTTFAFRPDGAMAKRLPGRVKQALMRRAITEVPWHLVRTRTRYELLRTALSQTGAPARLIDQIWDLSARDYSRWLARQIGASTSAVYAYEYSALEPFLRAKTLGVKSVLDLPSLSSRHFEALQAREREKFPELVSPGSAYFASRYAERQARRDAEIAAADVIFTNSKLTAQSHVDHGADPAKMVTVPLGAPPTIDRVTFDKAPTSPLKIVWAGTFSLRKGAHYLLRALERRQFSGHVEIDVYGENALPPQMLHNAPGNVTFHASIGQQALFTRFEEADALLFPTLSDGFGMVITEALARGLPVITTTQAGAVDFIQNRQNGLVIEAASATAIAEALQWCLDNRDALRAMREPARATAAAWQWADYRKAFFAALQKALEGTAA